MDARGGDQYNNSHAGNEQNAGQAYPFQSNQSDPFNAFINADDEESFDNSWQNPNSNYAPSNPQINNGFEHAGQPWSQPPYQQPEASYSNVPQFGIGSAYPSNDNGFQYPPAFNAKSADFASRGSIQQTPFQAISTFSPDTLSHTHGFDYSGSRELQEASQTISPAAIESHSSYAQSFDPHGNKSAGVTTGTFPQVQIRGGDSPAALSIQQWRQLATRTVKSIDRPGWRIKPTNQFASATQSKRFDGFIFVGTSSVTVNSGKGSRFSKQSRKQVKRSHAYSSVATVPRYKRKKSRNEAMQLLEKEKGDGPWHPDREPLVKKLKVAAAKQAGTKPSASAQSRSSSSSDSSDSDSDDSSVDGESEPEKVPDEPSPLPSSRPVDPNKAVEYDLIKAVWAKRSSVLPGPAIRSALTETWDIFKAIKDRFKSKQTSLQQAIEKKDTTNERAFERRVTEQRRLLESCINLTIKHGHPSIVEKLGENPALLVALSPFLTDRIKHGEYTGSFISTILQFVAQYENIDSSVLEKTKMDKLLQRVEKRGDDQGKALTKKIFDNAKRANRKSSVGSHANGVKRKTSMDDARIGPIDTNKRLPTEPSSTKASAGSPTTGKSKSAGIDAKANTKSASDTSDSKTKVVNVAAKPSGFFSSLKSASKKPGSSTKSEDGKLSAAPEKKNATSAAGASTAPTTAFSFAATMASLAKQKEETPAKVEEKRKPETAEEKRKRLRKEQRRKLRVSFKSDDELVSVRTFVHDPEEELGHEKSQVRDVGDSKGEGQMLKMHKDLELDEEDDYEPPEEIPSYWVPPLATDFGDLEESQVNTNYLMRGGSLEVNSPERELQQDREKTSLMAIYPSRSDIPPSPREPTDSSGDDFSPEQTFGPPGSVTEAREAEYRARRVAPAAAPTPPAPDINALLQIINSTKQEQPRQTQIQQTPPTDPSNPLNAIFAKLAPAPPAPMPGQNAAPAAFNIQAVLAGIPQAQQQSYQPAPAYNTPAANPVANLQALLSQFNNGQGGAPQAPPMQGYNYNSNPNPYPPMNEERKRQLEHEEGDYGRKKARGGKPFMGVPHLPCKFWQEGKCRKGDECTFLHDT